MKEAKRIPIQKCKEIAIDLGYDEVIIVGCHYASGVQSVATYGKSQAACVNAALGGNAVKKLLKWPEDKCNAKPARQLKKESNHSDVISQLKKFKYAGEDVEITISAPRIITAQTPDIFELIMGPYFTANCAGNQRENPERSVAPDVQ